MCTSNSLLSPSELKQTSAYKFCTLSGFAAIMTQFRDECSHILEVLRWTFSISVMINNISFICTMQSMICEVNMVFYEHTQNASY